MLEFKKLLLSDIDLIRPYFFYQTNHTCDCTIGGTFIWRDWFNTHYLITDDTLIFKVCIDGLCAFTFPLGKNIRVSLEKIIDYCHQTDSKPVFCIMTQSEISYMEKLYNINVTPERDWYDYLYFTEDFKSFSGNKFSGQRNHINRFKRENPDYIFEEITEHNIVQVEEFYKEYSLRETKHSPTLEIERNKIGEIFDNYELYGMIGGILKVKGEIIAFSIGEIIGDTLYTHIEKANVEYHGAYPAIINEFVKNFAASGIIYTNREDDAGDEGLRNAKMSYHPCRLIEKYTVEMI